MGKKIISFILMLCLCFAVSLTVFAAEPSIEVSNVTAEREDEITVKVSLSGNPGITSMKLAVSYDEDVLEYKSASIDSKFSGISGATALATESNGTVTLNWIVLSIGANDCTVNGTFAEIKFIVKNTAEKGDSKITVTYDADDVYNAAEENVTFSIKNGVVSVNVPCKHTNTSIINAKDATCSEKGYTGDTYCNDCETVIETGKVTSKNASNHVGGTEVKGVKEATCSAKGYTGDTHCKGCGVVVVKGSETAKNPSNHVGGTEVKSVKEATCSEKGYTGDTHCKGCGEIITKGSETAKDSSNHVGGTEVRNAKDATCSEKGYTGDTHCKGCGEKLEDGRETDTVSHKGGKATCTKKAVCDSCGNEYGEVDANAHKFSYKTITEPTCTEKGERETTCENGCGYKENDKIDELGHSWGKWETVKEATFEEKGLKERKCEREGCDEKETKEIDVLIKPTDPDYNSKPIVGVTIIDSKNDGESNPNTGAETICNVVMATAVISGVVLAVMKRKH